LDALPYWDAVLDSPGGAYYNTNRSIYHFLGPSVGSPEHGFGVVEGLMAYGKVARYPDDGEPEVTEEARSLVPRPPEGWLRHHELAPNSNGTWLIQRFAPENSEESVIIVGDKVDLAAAMPHHPLTMDPKSVGSAVYMTKEMILTCRGTDALAGARKKAGQLDILTYQACMDFGEYNMTDELAECPAGNEPQPRAHLQWANARCQQLWMHSQAHFRIGSQSTKGRNPSSGPSWDASWLYNGDTMDLATSTNDALFFIVWHANMMRHFVRWQQLALAKDPQMAERAYGYPTSRDDYSALNEGTALHDTINSKLPFKSGVFPMPPSNPDGYTHYDALRWSSPGMNQLVDYVEDTELQGDWAAAEETVNREQLDSAGDRGSGDSLE
jgi:hypothetical protein